MITELVIRKFMTRLALMPFFPASAAERVEISEMVEEFAETDEQVIWLSKRMMALYPKWPGPRELRAVFCSRFKPKDGISVASTTYLNGIPPEQPQDVKLLPPGKREKRVSQDPALALAITKAAEVMSMPPISRERREFSRHLTEILEGPVYGPTLAPTPQVVKPEDIERAVAANRERRARGVVEVWKEDPGA